MTSKQNSLLRTIRFDRKIIAEYPCLKGSDECYCFGEYRSGGSYAAGEMNQLIFNIKCPPKPSNPERLRYKEQAIQKVASALDKLPTKDNTLWVPVPGSKERNHLGHDDRLIQILEKTQHRWKEIIYQTKSYEADHQSPGSEPSCIVVFDDVITAGHHFKAMQKKLTCCFLNTPIIGFFIARTVQPG